MDFSIASILMLDGATNGAIYALLALALVLVFAVTRVIFIPQGEFVAYGALTLALLQTGVVPGTVWLLLVMALLAAVLDALAALRRGLPGASVATTAVKVLVLPLLVTGVTLWAAPRSCRCCCKACSRWPSSRRWARCCTGWRTTSWPMRACWCC